MFSATMQKETAHFDPREAMIHSALGITMVYSHIIGKNGTDTPIPLIHRLKRPPLLPNVSGPNRNLNRISIAGNA
jgi:hypothetical protein